MLALLPPTVITTAISLAQAGRIYDVDLGPTRNVCVEAIFTYGSGGTTVDAYLQTSFDDGATWVDIANFHFTTASAKKIINLSGLTPVATPITPTDGAIAANTAQDGVIGEQIRIKLGSTGTYAGNSTLQIVASGTRLRPH